MAEASNPRAVYNAGYDHTCAGFVVRLAGGEHVATFKRRVDADEYVGLVAAHETDARPMLTCRIDPPRTKGDELIVDAKELLKFVRQYRVIDRSPEKASECECCHGTGVGPENSNFVGLPCPVCRR